MEEVISRCNMQQRQAVSENLNFNMPLCIAQTTSLLDCENIGTGTREEEPPPSGGGGTRPPPSPACPTGQVKDSTGKCIPATPVIGSAKKKKSNWGLALLGAAAVIAGVYALA